jgi:pyridoxamine 5'-phosphate oxidase
MLRDIRKDYQQFQLDEKDLTSHPFDLFQVWLNDAIESKEDEPTAMTLSTSVDGYPDSRIVLLKELNKRGFVFFTNYHSAKGSQIERNRSVALNFFWPKSGRQVRVRGVIEKLDNKQSINYFHSRPRNSQLGAWASEQSSQISNREVLESRFRYYEKLFEEQEIRKPDYWGGYLVIPTQIEFWQGRANRLHDRFLYSLENAIWLINRLAP